MPASGTWIALIAGRMRLELGQPLAADDLAVRRRWPGRARRSAPSPAARPSSTATITLPQISYEIPSAAQNSSISLLALAGS